METFGAEERIVEGPVSELVSDIDLAFRNDTMAYPRQVASEMTSSLLFMRCLSIVPLSYRVSSWMRFPM